MKKIIIVLFIILPFLGNAQAHLGASFEDIKAQHTDKVFTIDYTKDGVKYTSAIMSLGTFFYYFDKETDLTYFCIQIPKDMNALNAQVEIYNKKYVIISETSWKAYLEDGGLMKINLIYDKENKTYYFSYAS